MYIQFPTNYSWIPICRQAKVIRCTTQTGAQNSWHHCFRPTLTKYSSSTYRYILYMYTMYTLSIYSVYVYIICIHIMLSIEYIMCIPCSSRHMSLTWFSVVVFRPFFVDVCYFELGTLLEQSMSVYVLGKSVGCTRVGFPIVRFRIARWLELVQDLLTRLVV